MFPFTPLQALQLVTGQERGLPLSLPSHRRAAYVRWDEERFSCEGGVTGAAATRLGPGPSAPAALSGGRLDTSSLGPGVPRPGLHRTLHDPHTCDPLSLGVPLSPTADPSGQAGPDLVWAESKQNRI